MKTESTENARRAADAARPDPDYFALVLYGVASFFGRAKTADDAVRLCVREIRASERQIGKLKPDARIKVNLFDLSRTGIDRVTWDDYGVKADGKPMPVRPQIVEVDRNGRWLSA